uniref:Actin-related protein 6 n=1 Tax=Ciona savignyi TaxID=51511 RepID=H2YY43_CIOSA
LGNTIILDNGASSLKIGKVDSQISIYPNSIFRSKSERRKNFVSNQIDGCKDYSSLFYVLPFQKGYLVNWDVQRQVWDHVFGKDVLNLKCNESNIVITEPHFNFGSIQEAMNEIFFEEYEFQSILRTNASTLSSHKYNNDNPGEECCVVVDCGYSFTHIVPYHKNVKVSEAVCRIDVGGKLLTNHLKEVISYRQLQVMDETYVMNQVKEDACYVSMDFNGDMETCKLKGKDNIVLRDYVLPDYTQIKRGYIKVGYTTPTKSQEQMIRLTVERFAVPEILFHPSDVGIPQMGLAEAIMHSVSKCSEDTQPHMLRNIVLTGGSCKFLNFKQRLEEDLRRLAPDHLDICLTMPENPVTYACEGGLRWTKTNTIREHWLTLEEYQEGGQAACARQFYDI